jgi:hypothetical protein
MFSEPSRPASGTTITRNTAIQASFQPSVCMKVAGSALLSQSTMLPMKLKRMMSKLAIAAASTAISRSHFLAPLL